MNQTDNFIPAGRDARLLKMQEDVLERMSTYAKSQRRQGETEEQAFYRLAVEMDPTFVEHYRMHVNLRDLR
ncbi:MAG: hypothetical protein U1E73_01825 [Planctomycetota bacterium]